MDFPRLNTVTLIEDDHDFRTALVERLEMEDFTVNAFHSAETALEQIDADFAGVVITDIRMPGMDGRQVLSRLQALDAALPVILITGHGDIAEAVAAMNAGAYDFVAKPFAFERLLESLKRALEKRALVLDNRRLTALSSEAGLELPLIGNSPAIRALRTSITQIANTRMDVLIEGETGSGKEAVARALHNNSRRRPQPFVAVNCGALPDSLIESELFGHELGAFSGAMRRRIGLVERAHNGTLFLDAVDTMPLNVQVKLLRVLEEREIHPVGADTPRVVDIRVLASSTDDLGEAVAKGRVREDLYYRLNAVRLRMPSLRERREDIPLLFASLLARAQIGPDGVTPVVTDEIRSKLLKSPWTGNIRELSHFAQRFALGLETREDEPHQQEMGLTERIAWLERRILQDTLETVDGNITEALRQLKIPRKTFYDKLKRHGLKPAEFRSP